MATINVTPGGNVDYTPAVTGSQPITFGLSGHPTWLSIDSLSGRVTGTVPDTQPAGTLNFDIVAQNCFSDGQPGNVVRQPMVIVVGSNCQPVSIFDSQTASCIPLQLVSTTYTNTIAKGQIYTDFTIRAEGDDSPGQPIVLWANSAGATLARVPGTERDYKLVIASGNLPDGTYTYNVFGVGCRDASGAPSSSVIKGYTVIVGTGVGGPPSTGGGGGGSCTATINAPGSHPVDQILNYQMSLTSGGSCGSWQTWFLYPGQEGGTTGAGSVPGQIDSVGISPGSYTKDVSTLPPGNYVIWAKCNDAAACQDTYVTKPIQLTAAGTPPNTGGGATPCVAPKLVPIEPGVFSMRPGDIMSFEIWLTDDSPVDGVSVTARDAIGAPANGAYLHTTVAWISSRRYKLTISFPLQNMQPQHNLIIEARNPCGLATIGMLVNRDDTPKPPPTNCLPTQVSTPPASQITDVTQVVSTLVPYTGTLPYQMYSPTHPNVWFSSAAGNTVKAEGQFQYGRHDVVITFELCDGTKQSIVWNIIPA